MTGLKVLENYRLALKLCPSLIALGNFGDCKSLGEGLAELRIHYGAGIRIYYSKIGNTVIVLFCGGDKSSQEKDINKAKEFLKEYQSRKAKNGKK